MATLTNRGLLNSLYERLPTDTDGVTDLEAGKSGHYLVGSSLPNIEDPLNRQAVQIVRLERAEFK